MECPQEIQLRDRADSAGQRPWHSAPTDHCQAAHLYEPLRRPIAALAQFFSIPTSNIIVIHDELDLEPGHVRLKRGGGENGHNGLRSTTKSLGTKDYLRIRVGIGRPWAATNPADYVLRPFSKTEREELAFTLPLAAEAAELLATEGLEAAQNRIHGR